MKAVSTWQDFVKKSKSNEHVSNIKEDVKNKLLEYLRSAPVFAAAAEEVYDEIADMTTGIPLLAYEKDGYLWDSRDIYYLDKYNMRLNDDFISYVLSKTA